MKDMQGQFHQHWPNVFNLTMLYVFVVQLNSQAKKYSIRNTFTLNLAPTIQLTHIPVFVTFCRANNKIISIHLLISPNAEREGELPSLQPKRGQLIGSLLTTCLLA